MGVHKAKQLFESIYGTDRIVVSSKCRNSCLKQLNVSKQQSATGEFYPVFDRNGGVNLPRTNTKEADHMVSFVDCPTYSMTTSMNLAKIVSGAINMQKCNLGKMVLVVDKTYNIVLDSFHDSEDVVILDNIKNGNHSAGAVVLEHYSSLPRDVRKSYWCHAKENKNVDLEEVYISIPRNGTEVKAFSEAPRRSMMPPPRNLERLKTKIPYTQICEEWLQSHSESVISSDRKVLTNKFLAGMYVGACGPETFYGLYKNAFFASKMEGLMLLYAHMFGRHLKEVLTSGVIERTAKRGRVVILFNDGTCPALKKMTREKRKEERKKTMERIYDHRTHIISQLEITNMCRNMFQKIPYVFVEYVAIGLYRGVHFRRNNIKGLYVYRSHFSEAEDDIIRFLSGVIDDMSPVIDFGCMGDKKAREYQMDTDAVSLCTWDDFRKLLNKWKLKGETVGVDVFSKDSDTLFKFVVALCHTRAMKELPPEALSVARSVPEKGNVNFAWLHLHRSGPAGGNESENRVGGYMAIDKERGTCRQETTSYDLTESPLDISAENILLSVLLNGSDYNSRLSHGGETEKYRDVMNQNSVDDDRAEYIRKETTFFEKMSCTCVGGWEVYVKEQQQQQNMNATKIDAQRKGYIENTNVSTDKCKMCEKHLVLPFWTAKSVFASQCLNLFSHSLNMCFPKKPHKNMNPQEKMDMHRAIAVNTGANIMAYLTMGAFNRRVCCGVEPVDKVKHLYLDKTRTENCKHIDAGRVTEAQLQRILYNKTKRKGGEGCTERSNNNKSGPKKEADDDYQPLIETVCKQYTDFYSSRTAGGILKCPDYLEREKLKVFGDTFSAKLDPEKVFSSSSGTCPGQQQRRTVAEPLKVVSQYLGLDPRVHAQTQTEREKNLWKGSENTADNTRVDTAGKFLSRQNRRETDKTGNRENCLSWIDFVSRLKRGDFKNKQSQNSLGRRDENSRENDNLLPDRLQTGRLPQKRQSDSAKDGDAHDRSAENSRLYKKLTTKHLRVDGKTDLFNSIASKMCGPVMQQRGGATNGDSIRSDIARIEGDFLVPGGVTASSGDSICRDIARIKSEFQVTGGDINSLYKMFLSQSRLASGPKQRHKSVLSKLTFILALERKRTLQNKQQDDQYACRQGAPDPYHHSIIGQMPGVDDNRMLFGTYIYVAMELVVIMYLNMAGLEDLSVLSNAYGARGVCQLQPLTHTARKTGVNSVCSTDCKVFQAAVVELIVMLYASELTKNSRIVQTQKNDRHWDIISKRLEGSKENTRSCIESCGQLTKLLNIESGNWVVRKGAFLPILGIANSKPLSPLVLWASFMSLPSRSLSP